MEKILFLLTILSISVFTQASDFPVFSGKGYEFIDKQGDKYKPVGTYFYPGEKEGEMIEKSCADAIYVSDPSIVPDLDTYPIGSFPGKGCKLRRDRDGSIFPMFNNLKINEKTTPSSEMPEYFQNLLNKPSEDYNKSKINELIKSKETTEEDQSIELANNKVRALVNALKLELHDRIVGVYINRDPYYEINIKLKGDKLVSPWMEGIVIDSYSYIGFDYGAEYNFKELENIYTYIIKDLRVEFGKELRGTSIDTKQGTISLNFYSEDNKKSFTKDDLISRLSKYKSKEMQQFLNLSLKITTKDLKAKNLVTAYGGASMNGCTANFIWLMPFNRTYGGITAGHCPGFGQPGVQYWKDIKTNSLFSIETRSEFFDSKRDFQFNVFNGSLLQYSNRVYQYSGGYSYKEINDSIRRSDHHIGDKICHYGKTTEKSCGYVIETNFAPPSNVCNGPCDPVYIKIAHKYSDYGDFSDLECAGGDSGGPVWRNYSAAGVFKGALYSSTDPCIAAFYMALDEIIDLGADPLDCEPEKNCDWDKN